MSIPKYQDAAEVIRRRIANGDYYASPLPGAPKLAQELGLSYMTVRQTMQLLLDNQDVIRTENGRLAVPGGAPASAPLKVALLYPAHVGTSDKWKVAIEQAAARFGCSLQLLPYNHADEAAVFEAFDAEIDLFFLQMARISNTLLNKIVHKKEKVVSLFNDLTDYGIRCFDGINIEAIGILMQQLFDRGCRRIDYINCEPGAGNVHTRKEAWAAALARLGCAGEPFEDVTSTRQNSAEHTLEMMEQWLAAGHFRRTDALFVTSVASARGAIRALANFNIRVPQDIAVVSFGNPEQARLNTPSIMAVNTPDLTPVINGIFRHYTGLEPQPERMYYRIELADLPPEEIILPGESVAPQYHSSKGN